MQEGSWVWIPPNSKSLRNLGKNTNNTTKEIASSIMSENKSNVYKQPLFPRARLGEGAGFLVRVGFLVWGGYLFILFLLVVTNSFL